MKKEVFILSESYTPPLPFYADALFLSAITDGHFWRTSSILSFTMTTLSDGVWKTIQYTADPSCESDEFSILESLTLCPPDAKRIFTYNGTSFLLPFLEKKFKAYRLENPFASLPHTDFYLLLKPLYRLFSLPSRRLSDFLQFLSIPEEESVALPALTRLAPYFDALCLVPDPEALSIREDEDHLLFSAPLSVPLPKQVSFHAGTFYLILTEKQLLLSVSMQNGRVRRYFPEYKEYLYLPLEGYAVHRSVASFLPKDRTMPATKDTAFTLCPKELLLENSNNAQAYLLSALQFLRSVLDCPAQSPIPRS